MTTTSHVSAGGDRFSLLLSLPAELRTMVYDFVMTEEHWDGPPRLDLFEELDPQLRGVASIRALFHGHHVCFDPPDSAYRGLLRCNRQTHAETRALVATKRANSSSDLARTLAVRYWEVADEVHLRWTGPPWLPCPYSKLEVDFQWGLSRKLSRFSSVMGRLAMKKSVSEPHKSPAFLEFWSFLGFFAAYCGPYRNCMANWTNEIRYVHPFALNLTMHSDVVSRTWRIYNESSLWAFRLDEDLEPAVTENDEDLGQTVICRLRDNSSLEQWAVARSVMIEYSDYHCERKASCALNWI